MKNENTASARLPESEEDVMMVLWKRDAPMTMSEIVSALSPAHSWKPATVHVLLERLCGRGFVTKQTDTFAHRYSAAVRYEDYSASEAKSFFSRFCGSSVGKLVAMMIDGADMKDEDFDDLYRLLDDAKARREQEEQEEQEAKENKGERK